jgi:uncharacterized protein YndB with AHSA1/START domain
MRDDGVGGPIRWKLHLPVSAETVYRALATDQGRASFWAERAVEKDGSIRFEFANGVTYEARILEREPSYRFAIEYFGGPATFVLASDGRGGTDLTLVHDGVPAEEWIETHAGWLNVLFPLKAYVSFGVDLRNHDRERLWDQGYADA